MTWPPSGHDRQRELFSDDAEPVERPDPEPETGSPRSRLQEALKQARIARDDAGDPDVSRHVEEAIRSLQAASRVERRTDR